MHLRTTWLLLLAVLLSAGALWFWGGEAELEGRRDRLAKQTLEIRPERVRAISFERDGLRMECRLVDGVWRIVAPVNARADAGEMDRILSALDTVARGEAISLRERQAHQMTLQDYGLERPRGRIEWVERGTPLEVLLLGREAPLGDSLYAMKEGAQEIWAVSSDLLDVWPESVVALRDRVVFHGDPRRVHRVEVRRAGGFLQLDRSPDGVWRIQQPISAVADRVIVRQWIDRLFEGRILAFMADVVSDATVYGLDDTATQITLWTEGQDAGQILWLGLETDREAERVFARRQDGASVFAVSADLLEAARIRPTELRDRALISLKPREIERIRIDRQVILQRTNGRWMVEAPHRWPAERARVEQLLEEWTGARVEQFAEAGTPGRTNRFTDQSIRLTFEAKVVPERSNGEAARHAITLTLSEKPDEEEPFWVRRDNTDSYFAVAEGLRAITWTNPLAYRSRTVFDLREEDIRSVDYASGSVRYRWEPATAGEWQPVGRAANAADSAWLAPALEALLTLRVSEYVDADPNDWAAYGLEEPAAVWTLQFRPDAGLGRVLMLGDERADGSRYARSLGEAVVFLLAPETAALLDPAVTSPAGEVEEE